MPYFCHRVNSNYGNGDHETSTDDNAIGNDDVVVNNLSSDIDDVDSHSQGDDYYGSGSKQISINSSDDVDVSARIMMIMWMEVECSNVKMALLYRPETWLVNSMMSNKLQAFIVGCLRKILRMWCSEKIKAEDLWVWAKEGPITQEIARRKWRYTGHILRKPPTNLTLQAVGWNPQGKRRVGWPMRT